MLITLLINSVLPRIGTVCNIPYNTNSGWVEGQINNLTDNGHYVQVITTSSHVDKIIDYSFDMERYIVVPVSKERVYETFLSSLKEMRVTGDVIHIFGTEQRTTLAALNYFPLEKTIISIQGLAHACADMFLKDFNYDKPQSVLSKLLPKFYFSKKGLNQLRQNGIREIESIKLLKNVAGRTKWDKALVKLINKNINYYYCNEVLRDEFYDSIKWKFSKIRNHSIFLTQIQSPIKGFDKFLQALSIVVQRFPDTKVYVASGIYESVNSIKRKILNEMVEWNSQINYMLDKYNLRKHIVFLQGLNAKEMIEQYLKAHVFVSPSRIENSSNSVCEAKILGVPCVVSAVGGCWDLIEHGKDGFLYEFSDYRMCAYYIMEIFKNKELASRLSLNAIQSGEKYNSKEENIKILETIYKQLAGQE